MQFQGLRKLNPNLINMPFFHRFFTTVLSRSAQWNSSFAETFSCERGAAPYKDKESATLL